MTRNAEVISAILPFAAPRTGSLFGLIRKEMINPFLLNHFQIVEETGLVSCSVSFIKTLQPQTGIFWAIVAKP